MKGLWLRSNRIGRGGRIASIVTGSMVVSMVVFGCSRSSTSSIALPGHTAQSADTFVDSIGVNTHLNYTDTVYGNFSGIVHPSLAYLGVRHIRDGLADDDQVLSRYRDLHRRGVDVTGGVPYEVTSMSALVTNIKTQRELLAGVEGPNETDEFTQFTYKGQKFPNGTKAFMQDFYRAVKNDPALKTLPVLQTTLAFPAQDGEDPSRAKLLGDLSAYADYANSHNYFAFGEPPGDVIAKHHLPANKQITPGKPIVSSEGGYQMGDGDGYKGGWDDNLSAPFDEGVHGRYILRYLLEQYRLGYQRSFVYELIDIDDAKWGLFRADGTPRPAATGIKAMIDLLHEATMNRSTQHWTSPTFTTRSLGYTLSKLPSTVHSVLVQKSSGVFFLIVWNDVTNWDPVAGKPLTTPPIPATLRLDEGVKRIRTFLPLTKSTKPISTSASRTVKLQVPDQPLIIEISP
jgi:hypothetical protein